MRFTLAKKLAAGFGLIIVLMGASYAMNNWSTSRVSHAQEEAEQYNEVAKLVIEKVVDHHKWLEGLNNTFVYNKDRVDVKCDPTTCSLGKWLTSEQATWLCDANPEVSKILTDLKPHHSRMHETAGAIDQLLQQRTEESRTQAAAIFRDETPVHLHALQEDLFELRDVVQDKAANKLAYVKHCLNQMFYTASTLFMIALGLAILTGILISRAVIRAVRMLLKDFKSVSDGDLTTRCELNTNDELGDLSRGFNQLVETLASVVSEIDSTAHEVACAATQIATSSEEVATGMTEQSTQVQQISSAIEQMSTSVAEVSQKSIEAADSAAQAGDSAKRGGDVVNQTIEGMGQISDAVSASAESVAELGKRGEQIGQIIDVINDIADQTNLLALNAAIEAARAGEHGRGFAVVADEVRKLADRTTKATEEIGDSISAIQTETDLAVQRMNAGTQQVGVGVERAKEAGVSLSEIVSSARSVAEMIQAIAAAAEQQSSAATLVAENIQSISSVTAQSAEGANQSAAASSQLNSKAEHLQTIVKRFKLAA